MGSGALDDDTRALLALLADTPAADLLALPPEQARAAARSAVVAPDAALPVRTCEALVAVPGAPPVRVRRYHPDAPPTAALLYLHGGGWLVGDLDTVDHVCRALAHRARCVVVSVEYRLAPEHPYPAALDDACAALDWMVGAAPTWGVPRGALAIGGDSAGGNLAVAACLRSRDRGGPRVGLQLLAYPVADADFDSPSYRENATGLLLTRAAMMGYWDRYVPDAARRADPYVSVARADLTGLPPAVVLTASHDPLRDEGELLARRLAEAGVPVRCARFQGTVHGFLPRFPVLRAGRVALTLLSEIIAAGAHQWQLTTSWPDHGAPRVIGPAADDVAGRALTR